MKPSRVRPTFLFFAILATGTPWFAAHAAKIYLDPATGKYPPGVVFGVDVRLNTDRTQCVNAAEVDISYPKDQLQAVAASNGNSIFSVWVKQPTIYKEYGVISFIGGLPGGYCGRVSGDPSLSNKLATLYFKFATSTPTSTLPQAAQLTFLSGTQAVLNDGLGTVASLTYAGASYALLQKGQYVPVNTWENAIVSDTAPPEPFTIGIYQDPSLFNNQWFAVFSTTDKQTGVDHYEVAEVSPTDLTESQSQWNWVRAVSPYLLKDQTRTDIIAVRAIDAAGNARVATYVPPKPVPATTGVQTWQFFAMIGIVGFVIMQIILRLL